MEFQEPALVAAMAAGADVGATSEVPNPDGALDRGWDLTRIASDGSGRPRVARRPQLSSLDLVDQKDERAVEDQIQIAARDLTAKKVLDVAEPIVDLLADSELKPVSPG